jgi:hypothetical protein
MALWSWLGVLLVAVAGCQTRTQSRAAQESTMKPLAVMYGQYLGAHRGVPPANEQQFCDFLKEKTADLARFGVKDVDSLFVSTRDQKPYVILYGKLTGPPGPAGQPVFAYEQVGSGGNRFVATSLGAVEDVDEATFKRLVPGAK